MKIKRLVFFMAMVFAGVYLFTSCNLDRLKNQTDLSEVNLDSIGLNGNWGVPLVSSTFVLGDYLDVLDSIEFIDTTNGYYSFVYELEKDTLVSVSDYFDTIQDVVVDGINYNFNFDIPGGIAGVGITMPGKRIENIASFSFSIEQFTIDEVKFASGDLLLDSLYSNLLDPNSNVQIDTLQIFLNQFTNENGDTLSFLFSQQAIDDGYIAASLAGYSLKMPGSVDSLTLSVYIKATVVMDSVSSSNNYDLGFSEFSLKNIGIDFITGRLATQQVAIDQSIEFNIDVPNLSGAISIMDPNIVVSTLNSTGVEGQVHITKAEFSNSGSDPWELFQNPQDKNIVLPPSNTFVDQEISIDEIRFSVDYNRFDFAATAILSPDGFNAPQPVMITPNSMIGFGVEVNVPLTLKIDNLTYEMSLADNLTIGESLDASNVEFIDTVALNLGFKHTLPFSFTPQIYLFDGVSSNPIDSIFKSDQFITRSFNDIEVDNKVVVNVTGESIKNILKAKQLKMKVRIDTEDQTSQINKEQYISLTLAARLAYHSLPSFNSKNGGK